MTDGLDMKEAMGKSLIDLSKEHKWPQGRIKPDTEAFLWAIKGWQEGLSGKEIVDLFSDKADMKDVDYLKSFDESATTFGDMQAELVKAGAGIGHAVGELERWGQMILELSADFDAAVDMGETKGEIVRILAELGTALQGRCHHRSGFGAALIDLQLARERMLLVAKQTDPDSRMLRLIEELEARVRPQKQRRRRPPLESKTPVLTPRQVEVMQIVGECKGNFADAARRLCCNRKTVKESYDAAVAKLGKVALRSPGVALKRRTMGLPEDRRGQVNMSESADKRKAGIVR